MSSDYSLHYTIDPIIYNATCDYDSSMAVHKSSWVPNKNLGDEDRRLTTWFLNWMAHKKGRTRQLYQSTLNRIKAFIGEDKLESLLLEDINKDWLMKFNDFLAPTAPSANSRALIMRNLRAVFNYAIDNDATTNYPFKRFKIITNPTRKRNYDIQTLRKIFSYEFKDKWLQRYVDVFKLSFMLIGINIIDLCNLKEIKNGRISYIRSKTGKFYDIKVEKEALELIEKYKGGKNLLEYLDNCNNYRYFYFNLRRGLKIAGKQLGIPEFTTYWARYSWATLASRLEISKDTIAAALGHGERTVTDIYIEFDIRKVDAANRQILDYIFNS